MAERSSDTKPGRSDRLQLAMVSKDAYHFYMDEMFDELENQTDPTWLDLEANELLLLVVRHKEFSPRERFWELASVSHFTMSQLRKFTVTDYGPEIVHQVEMIHEAYAQVYGQSMLELAKLDPSSQ